VSWRVGVRPEAELDVAIAASWYEAQRPGLGAEFIDDVSRTVMTLADNPLRNRVVQAGVRRLMARRFPYAIAYRVDGDAVMVISILHMSRDDASR
jgi:plasmid stabilization system protein ParE